MAPMTEGQVLVVCTGNICRSPLIERLLQHALDERWGPGVVPVRSAGTMGLHDHPMTEQSAVQLARLGGDATGFRARRLTRDLVAAADLVLTAAREHRAAVVQAYPRALSYTFTFRDFADLAEHLPDEELPTTSDGSEWVQEVTQALAARRGLRPPLSLSEADIADPYGLPDAAYQRMSDDVARALPHVLRVLARR